MSESDLRTSIKEMLVKNLMLQTPVEEIGDDLPLFGPDGLGLDSIDALELAVSMEKTFGVSVPNSEVAGKARQSVTTILVACNSVGHRSNFRAIASTPPIKAIELTVPASVSEEGATTTFPVGKY